MRRARPGSPPESRPRSGLRPTATARPGALGLALSAIALALAAIAAAPGEALAAKCKTPDVPHEPPCNPALPQSPWGASHRSSYAQGSAAVPGLRPGDKVKTQHIQLPGIPIVLDFTDRYRDGGRAVWGSLINAVDERAVFKVDHQTGELIDLYIPGEREANAPPALPGGNTGSYNILSREGHFIVPRQRSIDVYADGKVGRKGSRKRRFSDIRLVKRFSPPDSAFCRADDRFVGATMTYDGKVAFVTVQGKVGIVPRKPKRMTGERMRVVSINGEKCGDGSVPTASLEQISNSIAADENGGIYVVTSKLMRKVEWDSKRKRLRLGWRAPYEAGGEGAGVSLGQGSGATPSLVGTGRQGDRFVAITDAQPVMNLVLFWRDGVPKNARPEAAGTHRRIACQKPVRFGDPDVEATASEQSVLVRGYASVIVQNLLQDESVVEGFPGILEQAAAALYGGDPALAPRGVERIDWNPRKRRCERNWTSNASIPNAVPTMSQASGLFYAIGQRQGDWGVRTLDFATGRGRMFSPAPSAPCEPNVFTDLPAIVAPFILPLLQQLPNSCENSFFAATEVGPDRTIYTGTFAGMTIYRPKR